VPLVGAVAVPHSHLQLFFRPKENEEYRARVMKGREALFKIRDFVDSCRADTLLLIHDDHFVNFDFRCYPPFALFTGREAKGSGVIDPAEIEKITGATYRKYEGKESYASAPKGIPQHMADWETEKPYVYEVNTDLSVKLLKDLMQRGFDMPFTTNGTMDGELVLTTNFLNPKADKKVVLMLTNGYVPPLPWPRRCWELGRAMREIFDASKDRVLVLATGGMSHYPGTPLYGDVDEDFDHHVLDLMAKGENRKLADFTPDELMQHGDGELVNWIIAAGMVGDGKKSTVVEYVRLWHIGLGYAYWEV
jgi:aromatic ring-opening dioxygenase catalytic subunit (LigB family)